MINIQFQFLKIMTLVNQSQNSMLYPRLDLVLQPVKALPQTQSCLIDTGFDQFLIINQATADNIGFVAKRLTGEISPYSKKPVPREVGEIEVSLTLEDGTQYILEVSAIVYPEEPTCIIGSAFLQKLCKELDCKLTFDYHRDKVILN
jgi:predicted aspartyl protease